MQSHIFSHERVCPFCLTSHQSKTELFKHLEGALSFQQIKKIFLDTKLGINVYFRINLVRKIIIRVEWGEFSALR